MENLASKGRFQFPLVGVFEIFQSILICSQRSFVVKLGKMVTLSAQSCSGNIVSRSKKQPEYIEGLISVEVAEIFFLSAR